MIFFCCFDAIFVKLKTKLSIKVFINKEIFSILNFVNTMKAEFTYPETNQSILLKRAYDSPSPDDGYRVYIDRLWPQGLSHETFHYDWWDKAISPSTQLRQWFHADPQQRWPEFETRYKTELLQNPAFAQLRQAIEGKPVVTLLYSSKDRNHNNAIVVRNALLQK